MVPWRPSRSGRPALRRVRSLKPAAESLEGRALLAPLQGAGAVDYRAKEAEEARYEQDTARKLGAFWDVVALSRDALQVPWASRQFGQGADANDLSGLGKIGPSGLNLSARVAEVEAARALIQAATQLFDQARNTPDPQGSQLNQEGNNLLERAAPTVNRLVNLWFTAQDWWISTQRQRDRNVFDNFPKWRPPPGFPLQAAYAEGGTPPLEGKVRQDEPIPIDIGSPGGPINLKAEDWAPTDTNPKVTPQQWESWTTSLYGVIARDVFKPMKAAIDANPEESRLVHGIQVTVRIFKDPRPIAYYLYPGERPPKFQPYGRIEIVGVSSKGVVNDSGAGLAIWERWAVTEIQNMNARNLVPAYPAGSTREMPITRTLTFTYNTGVSKRGSPPPDIRVTEPNGPC